MRRSYSATDNTTTAGLPRLVTVCGVPFRAASTTVLKLFFASCRDQRGSIITVDDFWQRNFVKEHDDVAPRQTGRISACRFRPALSLTIPWGSRSASETGLVSFSTTV